jgi:small subunit ribosomal protein S27Ae
MGKQKKSKTRGKKKHKPGKSTKKGDKYKVEGGKLVRAGMGCPKCGPGVHMGEHKDRYTCGKCTYSEFKKQ